MERNVGTEKEALSVRLLFVVLFIFFIFFILFSLAVVRSCGDAMVRDIRISQMFSSREYLPHHTRDHTRDEFNECRAQLKARRLERNRRRARRDLQYNVTAYGSLRNRSFPRLFFTAPHAEDK